jgi:uncharacterized membrane protein YbhN (UPF0104 family)
VRLVIGLGLLGFVLSRVDFSRHTLSWDAPLVLALVTAMLLILLAQAVSASRWRLILGAGAPPWRYLFRLYLVGTFFSVFLPTSIGGDAIRTVAAARALDSPGAAVSSVLVDRLFGVGALLSYLALGVLLNPEFAVAPLAALEWSSPVWLLPIGAVVAVALAWVARRPRVRNWVRQGRDVIRRFRGSPGALVSAVFLSFVVQGLYIVAWAALSVGTRISLGPGLLLLGVPLVSLAAMLPITFSGLGVREGLWLLILAGWGVPSANVVAFSLLFFVSFALAGAVGGIVFVAMGTEIERNPAGEDRANPAAYGAGGANRQKEGMSP